MEARDHFIRLVTDSTTLNFDCCECGALNTITRPDTHLILLIEKLGVAGADFLNALNALVGLKAELKKEKNRQSKRQ